jgi:hypothetical protein
MMTGAARETDPSNQTLKYSQGVLAGPRVISEVEVFAISPFESVVQRPLFHAASERGRGPLSIL